MKKKYFLLCILLSLLSCSNDEPEYIFSSDDPRINYLIHEGGVKNIFGDLRTIHDYNDSLVFFSGMLKDMQRSGFIGFNLNTKNKLFDLIVYENITLNLGYGETTTSNVYNPSLVSYTENLNSNVLYLTANINGTPGNVGFVYFINDNSIKKIIYPSSENCYNLGLKVYNWKQNFLIINDASNDFSFIENYLYNQTGEVVSVVKRILNNTIPDRIDVINDFDAIVINSNNISKIDLREDYPVWQTTLYIYPPHLNSPKYDDFKLASKTDTHFTYGLHYTEYSGNKGVLKFIVNIETGEVEYL